MNNETENMLLSQDLPIDPIPKENGLDYHDPKYQEARHEYVERIREIIENGVPEPQKDWDTIWILSGPEIRFDDSPESSNSIFGLKQDEVNQTNSRFVTGLSVAKNVAAIRCNKDKNGLSISESREFSPTVYFNGLDRHNDYIKSMIADGSFEQKFEFPSEKLILPPQNHGVRHTGDQFENFPHNLVPQDGKLVIVSDLYHLPRVEKYLNKYPIVSKNKAVLYPAVPVMLPVGRALQEARKLYPYTLKGIL